MIQRDLLFLLLIILCQPYSECQNITDFDYKLFYTGLENVLSFLVSDYPTADLEVNPLETIHLEVQDKSTENCVVDHVYPQRNVAKFTCIFPSVAFPPRVDTSMNAKLTLYTKSKDSYVSGQYEDLIQYSAENYGYAMSPRPIVMKKGVQFTFRLSENAIIDATRMRVELAGNAVKVVAYQSGLFFLQLVEDHFADQETLSMTIYDKDDPNKLFLRNTYTDKYQYLFPTTDKYIIGLDRYTLLSSDKRLKVLGKIAGNPTQVDVYAINDVFLGHAPILEIASDYMIIERNDALTDNTQIRLPGHEGTVVVSTTSYPKDVHVMPLACQEFSHCTLRFTSKFKYSSPLRMYALNKEGEQVDIPFSDVSIAGDTNTVLSIASFPSHISSALSFSVLDEMLFFTSSTFESVPLTKVFFTSTWPEYIIVQAKILQPTIYMYGAGQEEQDNTVNFQFRPYAGGETVMFLMTKGLDPSGVPCFYRIITDLICLTAYACYKEQTQIAPITPLTPAHTATITFSVVSPLLHRIYFETSIKHPTDNQQLEFMDSLSDSDQSCNLAHFSLFQTIESSGGTWIDVSVTNSGNECIQTITHSLITGSSKQYKSLRLTGQSTGSHPQIECTMFQPVLFRQDCSIPDKNYFIPVPPPVPAELTPSKKKANSQNYVPYFFIAFSLLVVGIATAWYFLKYRKRKLQQDKTDRYARMMP